MIVKVLDSGQRAGGLMHYLFGDGKANEHTNQRVLGSNFGAEFAFAGQLDKADRSELGAALEADWVLRRNGQRELVGASVGESGHASYGRLEDDPRPHIMHITFSADPNDGVLTDDQWRDIVAGYMTKIGVTDEVKGDCRYVIVHHGLSGDPAKRAEGQHGNNHVHVAVCTVRENGTRYNAGRGLWNKSVAYAREVEQTYGLRQLAAPGKRAGRASYTAGELRRSSGSQYDTERAQLARLVRTQRDLASDERDFVCRLSEVGVLAMPYFGKGTTDEVVGYKVALKSGGLSFGGKTLGRDLSLPMMREYWETTREEQAKALPYWRNNHAATKDATRSVETRTPQESASLQAKTFTDARTDELWRELSGYLADRRARLVAADPNEDCALFAQTASDLSTFASIAAAHTKGGTAARFEQAATKLSRGADDLSVTAVPRSMDTAQAFTNAYLLARSASPNRAQRTAALLTQMRRLALVVAAQREVRGELAQNRALISSYKQDLASVQADVEAGRAQVATLIEDRMTRRPTPDVQQTSRRRSALDRDFGQARTPGQEHPHTR